MVVAESKIPLGIFIMLPITKSTAIVSPKRPPKSDKYTAGDSADTVTQDDVFIGFQFGTADPVGSFFQNLHRNLARMVGLAEKAEQMLMAVKLLLQQRRN